MPSIKLHYGFCFRHTRYSDIHLWLDHNPPHIHVRSGTDNFSITIKNRIIEGVARSKTVSIINQFMDEHEDELMELWEKAQKGKTNKKIR